MAHNIEHGPINVPSNVGSPYSNPTNLLHSISKYSLVGPSAPIEDMGAPINQEGTDKWNRGLSFGDANPSPFDVSGNTGDEGHLVDLLTKDINSTRLSSYGGTTFASNPAQSQQWMGNAPGSDLDLEGEDPTVAGQPQIFTTGLGQNDGKKLNGKDLHVEMMQNTYSYTHGPAGPWQTTATVGDTPSLSPYQDLTKEWVTGPLGYPADKIPEWNYFDNGPSSPFNS